MVVGIAARLNPVKDMSTLIRGFAEGHKSCPRLRLEETPRRILEDRPLVGTDEPIFSPREDEL